MNIPSIVGIFGTLGALVISMFWGGTGVLAFLDIPSTFIVIVASISIVIYSGPKFSDGLGIFNTFGMTFKTPDFGELEIARKLLSFSEKARREGLLSLEEEIQDIDNDFLRTGLRLSIDGTDRDIIMNLLEIEINKMQERHAKKVRYLDLWAQVGPACGMWGTVVGLVGMMKNLASDPAMVGPNMATALITTLYGSVVANVFAIPAARKLRSYDAQETNAREMIIEGVLSIQAGDNPRILGQKLLAYLSPEDRRALEQEVKND
ncbi:MAG: motility protein A [Treponema sp.]|nr:motility protein A [Treponema sp.]